MAEKTTEIGRREGQRAERQPAQLANPFSILERFFDDFGFGRNWLAPRGGRQWSAMHQAVGWVPQIEVYQRNNELIVRADLPGMKKEDVNIEVTDHEIIISGERRQEQESEHEGLYRSERIYGSFYRAIPLPEGTMTDEAKASFRDGVLEVTIPAPPQTARGRRLEIKDAGETKT